MCEPQRAGTPQTDMDRVVEEYKASTDDGLVNFVKNVIDGNLQNPSAQNYSIGKVADRAVADIQQMTGVDVTGFTHNLKGNHVEHIEYRHGEVGKQDSSMADINDYGKMKYVLYNYDTIELSLKKKYRI
jgi:hypothetical protein